MSAGSAACGRRVYPVEPGRTSAAGVLWRYPRYACWHAAHAAVVGARPVNANTVLVALLLMLLIPVPIKASPAVPQAVLVAAPLMSSLSFGQAQSVGVPAIRCCASKDHAGRVPMAARALGVASGSRPIPSAPLPMPNPVRRSTCWAARVEQNAPNAIGVRELPKRTAAGAEQTARRSSADADR